MGHQCVTKPITRFREMTNLVIISFRRLQTSVVERWTMGHEFVTKPITYVLITLRMCLTLLINYSIYVFVTN